MAAPILMLTLSSQVFSNVVSKAERLAEGLAG